MQQELPVNILLVDDRSENLLALEAMLSPLGHTLVHAHSGKEALKALLTQDFAVVLMDVQMPGMDGFETAGLIRGRERSQDTPIIFLTAVNTSDVHVFRGYEVGAVDYMLKPIVPEVLLSKVTVFVDLYCKTEKVRRQRQQLETSVQALEREIGERQRVEAALRQVRDELELRVQERTAGLAAANTALQQEIVERQRAEEERAQMLVREQHARSEAEAAVRVRDQFLSIASHELKTPLTALYGYLQLIQRRFDRSENVEEHNQRLLNTVLDQTNRLHRLIEALLDISRIQTGQLTIIPAPVDLHTLMLRLIAEVQATVHHHTLVFHASDQSLFISGDELRLEQVFRNLMHNAVKYSPEGGVITVATGQFEQYGCVSVTDQGIGIPHDSLPHLFQRFYRAENVDERTISGMGVGLYVVKEIVGLHGGKVEVASVERVGSTFTVSLPLHHSMIGAETQEAVVGAR